MQKYDISVIIPIYNNEKFLERSVNSVINQTFGFERIELILIDDNSTDSSRKIMDTYDNLYENCKCIYLEKNSGSPCTPRNIGIENASADFLMFIDANDTYDERICEILFNKIVESDNKIVGCQYKKLKYGEEIIKKPLFDCSEINVNILDNNILLKNGVYWWMPWDKIYNKKFIIDNNICFPPDTLAEDVYFILQFSVLGEKILYLNEYCGYNWNILDEGDESSLCHTFNENNLLKFMEGYQLIFDLIKGKRDDSLNILFDQFLRSLFSVFCLLDNVVYDRKVELLDELYNFEKSLNLNINFEAKWAIVFNKLLLRKNYKILIPLSKVMGIVWSKFIK